MRTIKFRGFNAKNNQWLYGSHILNRGKHFVAPDEFANGKTWEDYEVEEESIGQFTGLTDKNGNGIFEGDVIRINLTDGSTTISSVVWNRRGYWGCDIDINHGVQLGLIDKVRIEVIGNIHNPELLEKGGEK